MLGVLQSRHIHEESVGDASCPGSCKATHLLMFYSTLCLSKWSGQFGKAGVWVLVQIIPQRSEGSQWTGLFSGAIFKNSPLCHNPK